MCYDIVMVTGLNYNRHRKEGRASRWRLLDLMQCIWKARAVAIDGGLVIYLASVTSVYHHEQHGICDFSSLEKVTMFR